MDPIHMNRKSMCLNIIINLCLLSLMVYIVKTSNKPCPISNKVIKQMAKDNDSLEYFPKGDWIINTIDYRIIAGNILCGVIFNKKEVNIGIYSKHTINPNDRSYNNDCIMFTKNDIITTSNGKFKIY